MKEFIICSAIIVQDGVKHKDQPIGITKGFVVCGRRHGDCYETIKHIARKAYGYNQIVLNNTLGKTTAGDMGFLTNTNRFVDRKEAMKIAIEANQLLSPELHKGKSEDDPMFVLTSEDLFID